MACVAAAIAALLLIVTLSVSASAAPSPIAPSKQISPLQAARAGPSSYR
jgi:hypothetical protein